MQFSDRTLLALALGSLLAAAAAASEIDAPANNRKPAAVSQAADAVSQRTTTRESGRMMQSPVKAGATIGATGTAAANPGKGNWWADADIDGDGKLSLAEAKAQAGLEARFSSVDRDADGFVTNAEYRSFFTSSASQGEAHAAAHSSVVTRDLWLKLDGNGDGKLSSGEVSANAGISGAFAAIDSNGDGFVTQAEYSAYAKAELR